MSPAPPPAVMVDTGFPWWVTSTVAACVLATSALVFWRTSRSWLRGVVGTLAVQAVAAALLAPFLMSGEESWNDSMGPPASSMGGTAGDMMGASAAASPRRGADALPFTFFFTRYEFLGDPNNPDGVRYHSDGIPIAKAPDGSTLILSGNGGWDPSTGQAEGGGEYLIEDAAGDVTAEGRWHAIRFVSFRQLSGFWDGPFREEGWQGPSGSTTFSGFLVLRVELERLGTALLTAWCVMPGANAPRAYTYDGIKLVGPRLRFTNFKANEGRLEGGVMFYGPGTRR